MDNDSLVTLFCELVRIPSPSGQEAAVAAAIKERLETAGITCAFDNAQNDSNTHNLIARVPGDPALPVLLFVAHMDTVETGEKPIKPLVKDGIITSDGSTVLGADDKAAVACLLEILPEIAGQPARPTVIAAFTTREEQGQMGSSLLDLPEKIDMAFNIDGPNELGDFAYQMLGETPFSVIIHGKAAHAAVEPEKGANALVAAGNILVALPIGKNEQGTVLNIGTVRGGIANNVVPDFAELRGQARAYTQTDLDEMLKTVETTVADACSSAGCTYEFALEPEKGAPPAALATDHPMVDLVNKATADAGFTFNLIKLAGTSDANYLAAHYPTLTVCRGSKHPHAFSEEVSIADLHGLKRLLHSLIAVAGKKA